MATEIEILKLDNLNTLIIKNKSGKFFIASPESIIISIPNLAALLSASVKLGYVSPKVLEGILSEVQE